MKKRRITLLCILSVFVILGVAVRAVLRNTKEIASHNMLGATGNKVYVDKEGHAEAVYDREGNLVKDCVNMGSYNYHGQNDSPFGHFLSDSLPWILLGNCPDDPSAVSDRFDAYLDDFGDGVMRTFFDNEP